MRLYIPEIGKKIILLENWEFKVQDEHSNISFLEKYFDKKAKKDKYFRFEFIKYGEMYDIMLPKGTAITIKKIVIKKDKDDSLIIFRIEECPVKKVKKKCFWTQIKYANEIDFFGL